jgi:acyl-ACP thioesterase
MMELPENNIINISKFTITTADTDIKGRVRLGSFVNLLIQSAINSADDLGFGYKELKREKLFWVLSRLTVEIKRPLVWYETAQVNTWPKDIDRLFYLRDFLVRGRKGDVIAKATSAWLAIDYEKKRPKNVGGIHREKLLKLRDLHALGEPPEKLEPIREGEEFTANSNYFDLDLNRHVTATRYIDWVVDSLSLDFHETNYPKRLSINYLRETLPGQSIRFLKHEAGGSRFYFEGTNVNKNTTAFRCCIDF